MKLFVEQLSLYAQQNSKSDVVKIAQYGGAICLLFSVLVLLGWIHLGVPNLFGLNFSWVGMVALLIYYYLLDVKLAAVITIPILILTIFSNLISQPYLSPAGLVFFVCFLALGVIGLLLSRFLQKKPLFAHVNWLELLLLPLVITADALCTIGLRKDLHDLIKAPKHQ